MFRLNCHGAESPSRCLTALVLAQTKALWLFLFIQLTAYENNLLREAYGGALADSLRFRDNRETDVNMKVEEASNHMRKSFLLLFARLMFGCLPAVALAQRPGGAEDAAACAACGACASGLIVVPLAIIALNIALLIWVARDAKSRGMDNAVMWMILVMVASVPGLIIYLFSRPQGNLVRCASCNQQRLEVSAKCPHCGNA